MKQYAAKENVERGRKSSRQVASRWQGRGISGISELTTDCKHLRHQEESATFELELARKSESRSSLAFNPICRLN